MERYGNTSGKSGVKAYEIVPDGIRIMFVTGEIYRYTFGSAGKERIVRMRSLAKKGKGLSTYISQFVKDDFEVKEG
jgi:hypothetical protein